MKQVDTFITKESGFQILNIEITLTKEELENEHFKEKGEAKLILKRRMKDVEIRK